MRQITPWYLSSHGNFLGVLSSSFAIFKYTRLSPTRNYPGAVTALFVDTLNIEILIVVDKSTYLLLSQEPIQVLSGVMRSCMFSFSGRSVDPTVYIIYFLLVIATLLGVSQRGGSSSLLYPAKTGTIGCPPILFIFTRCISTPWIFTFTSFSAMSDTEIYSRDPLLSCGSFFLCCL